MMLTFKMTMKRALELGLVFCKCGHRPNNHFAYDDKACAHCECKKLELHGVSGTTMRVHRRSTKQREMKR